MAESIVFPQWRDQQRNSRYPFADDSTCPDGLASIFVDAALFPFKTAGSLWLSKIAITEQVAVVTVTDGVVEVTGSLAYTGLKDKIDLFTVDGRSAGVLVGYTAGIPDLFAMQRGETTYTKTQTEFAAGCIMPMPTTGVLSVNAGGAPMTGRVVFIGENGVRLGWNGAAVQVDVIGVMPKHKTAVKGLRTISLIAPNSRGAFDLVPSRRLASDSILRVTSSGHSVYFNLVGTVDATT